MLDRPSKVFVYFLHDDDYFLAIFKSLLEETISRFPGEAHIIIPAYGTIIQDEKSRYPKQLKQLSNLWRYLKSEYKVYQKALLGLNKLIPKRSQSQSLKLISVWRWYFHLAINILYDKHKSASICGDDKKQSFIINYAFKGIKIGDLIADTFIRYYGKPSFELNSPYTDNIIWRANSLASFYLDLIPDGIKKDIFFFGSYTTYINHGVPVRVALKKRSRSITFGNVFDFYKIHDPEMPELIPMQGPNHMRYTESLAYQSCSTLFEAAESSLERRVSNQYDQSMNYMRDQSSNLQMLDSSKNVGKSRILMLHDFFDAVHKYQWLIFPDFWDWVVKTAEFCEKNHLNILLKPHPNQRPASADVVNSLKYKFANYKFVGWIPETTKNSEILRSKPKLIITAYGSVASESSFMGIPTLLAGDHPGINFSVGYTARTKQDYFNCISAPQLAASAISKNSAIFFTALHHKNTFLKQNQSLNGFLGVDVATASHNASLLKSNESVEYIKENICRLLNELNVV